MITPEKAIEALKKRLAEIEGVSQVSSFNNWKKTTTATLLNFYDKEDVRLIGFTSIKAYIRYKYTEGGRDRLSEAKIESSTFLNGLIEDIEIFGIPQLTKDSNGSVSVNVSQNSNQNQTTNVNINLELFIEAIKDELKGGQVKELKAILDGDEEPEQKKKSFVDKIKSFGSDVASNILANVLTNPQVYEKIGGMF